MPAPRAWSFSSLDSFVTCARKFHAEAIEKSVPREESEAMRLGTEMHLRFERRVGLGVPLPGYMAQHESYAAGIEAEPGQVKVERKVGLTVKLQPCDFFASDVWWRGVLDVHVRRPDGTHRIADYKTGKVKPKQRQLELFAMYAIIEGATRVDTEFYWTQTQGVTAKVYDQTDLPMILQSLVPDLKAYKEAFKLDIWNPKPSGLCRNHCQVVGCEFHGVGFGRR